MLVERWVRFLCVSVSVISLAAWVLPRAAIFGRYWNKLSNMDHRNDFELAIFRAFEGHRAEPLYEEQGVSRPHGGAQSLMGRTRF